MFKICLNLRDIGDKNGKFWISRFATPVNVNNGRWSPQICSYNNQTFFLQADLYHKMWYFWVAVLGNEEEAQKYEVELSIPKKDHKFYMGYRGKVFSTNERVQSVVKDHDNVLRLDNTLAEVKADGSFQFSIDYQIIRK